MVLVGFVLLLEGVLTVYPRLSHAVRDASVAPESLAIACIGDSVTYGDGLQPGQAWPEQLGAALSDRGLPVSVHNLGTQGQTSHALRGRGGTFIKRLPAESTPVVLVMMGHNDFLFWPVTRPDGQHAFEQTPDAASEVRRGWEPRLLRISRWIAGALAGEVPVVNLAQRQLTTFTNNLQRLKERVDAREGRLYLMTYAIPGAPTPDMPDHRRDVLLATQTGQAEINTAIRQIAAAADVAVIDIEQQVPMRDPWSPAEMLDHIHLTTSTSGAVADEVRRRLVTDGVLPVEAL